MPKQIRLNAFDMNCVGHQSPGLWTHPRDRADRYNTLEYWVELAKLLERGKFDALFLADVLGVYDVFRGSPDAAIANAVQVPVNDPLLLIPAMAYVTRNLGFGVSYEHPYTLARRFSTLDHLTGGRTGQHGQRSAASSVRNSIPPPRVRASISDMRSIISPTCSPALPIIRRGALPNSCPGTGTRSEPPAPPLEPAPSPSAYGPRHWNIDPVFRFVCDLYGAFPVKGLFALAGQLICDCCLGFAESSLFGGVSR